MSPLSIGEIVRLLAGAYGNIDWSKHSDPLSELIVTILSQNTSDHNSRIAYASLMSRFGDWQAVADAGVDEIEDAIKMGGLSRVKAPRIRQILRDVSVQRGSFDLSFLAELPAGEAKAWLQRLPGVGPKTAACVLLFSLGMPVLPVDTHIHRVAKRLGLISAGTTAGDAHDVLGKMVPPEDVYRFHILVIEHGRRTCKAQNPRCHQCVLFPECPAGQFLLGTAREVSVGDEIMERARSLFDMAGVAKDPSTGRAMVILGLVSTPERDLDDFVAQPGESLMRGFILHAKDREDALLDFIRNKGFSAELVGELGYSPSGKPNLKHLAVAAGLGSQGKNTLVINSRFGPWLRFMAIRTDAPLAPTGPGGYTRERNRLCEDCRACIDACPVNVLEAYRLLDAGRCLAAISGDRRGELAICDRCVVVCPVGERKIPG